RISQDWQGGIKCDELAHFSTQEKIFDRRNVLLFRLGRQHHQQPDSCKSITCPSTYCKILSNRAELSGFLVADNNGALAGLSRHCYESNVKLRDVILFFNRLPLAFKPLEGLRRKTLLKDTS